MRTVIAIALITMNLGAIGSDWYPHTEPRYETYNMQMPNTYTQDNYEPYRTPGHYMPYSRPAEVIDPSWSYDGYSGDLHDGSGDL